VLASAPHPLPVAVSTVGACVPGSEQVAVSTDGCRLEGQQRSLVISVVAAGKSEKNVEVDMSSSKASTLSAWLLRWFAFGGAHWGLMEDRSVCSCICSNQLTISFHYHRLIAQISEFGTRALTSSIC
jgi:hypothetical protein